MILPSQSQCGWAFRVVGLPWVAQRVCPIPSRPASSGRAAISRSRSATLPAVLTTPVADPSVKTATPAES
jgi:hypothetical protein